MFGAFKTALIDNRKWLSCSLFVGVGLFLFCVYIPGFRTGDGSEYYAMYFGWRDTFRPYVTAPAWENYTHFSLSFQGLQSQESLQQTFKPLALDGQQDFNHFWFYSLLAAIPSRLLQNIGLDIAPSTAFGITNSALVAALFGYAVRNYGRSGVIVAVVIIFASPALWFINKVHTELFTITLTTIAFAALWRGRMPLSALAFSIAATQNPSIGIAAVVALLFWLPNAYRSKVTLLELITTVLTICMLTLSPIYYFFRYAALTPQLFFTGAELESASVGKALVFLVNPDIGLFPNWPLGLVIFSFSLFIGFRNRTSLAPSFLKHSAFYTCAAIFVIANLYAQSTTVNTNSGGTHHIARYATWYLCLFFVPSLFLFEWARKSFSYRSYKSLNQNHLAFSLGRIGLALFFVPIAAAVVLNAMIFHPTRAEAYLKPSPASTLLWKVAPELNRPPLEIFLERMGGSEGPAIATTNIIIGIDCRTTAYHHLKSDSIPKILQPHCKVPLDPVKLGGLIQGIASSASSLSRVEFDKYGGYGEWGRVKLNKDELREVIATEVIATVDCLGLIDFSSRSNLSEKITPGFSAPEGFGRWSDGERASFSCNRPLNLNSPLRYARIMSVGFVPSDHRQRLLVSVNSGPTIEVIHTRIAAEQIFDLDLPVNDTSGLTFEFMFPDATSPKELGLSADARRLGVAIKSIEFR